MEIAVSSSDSSASSASTEPSSPPSSPDPDDCYSMSLVHKPRKHTSAEFHSTQRYSKHEDHMSLRRETSADSVSDENSDGSDDYHRPVSWFNSLKKCVQETDMNVLDLSDFGLKINEVSYVLEFLAGSQVTELNLSGRNLRNEVESLSELLMKTKIRKLNVSSCHLQHDDILSLMKVVTGMRITNLNISKNKMKFLKDDGGVFVSHLLKSHITDLNLKGTWFFSRCEEALSFIKALRDFPLTHLNLKNTILIPETRASFWLFLDDEEPDTSETLLSLFSNLKSTSITHLNFAGNCIGLFDLKRLGDSLRESKLVELDLSKNYIDDDGVNSIFEALVGTKITYLNLASNAFRGSNKLGSFLKETQLKTLDLSNHWIDKSDMFSFPTFLKDSSVTCLRLYNCCLPEKIGKKLMASLRFSKLVQLDVGKNALNSGTLFEFARTMKHTSITDFHFSQNCRFDSRNETALALVIFGAHLAKSNLKHVNISQGFYCLKYDSLDRKDRRFALADFLETIKNCSVTSIDLSFIGLGLDKIGGELLSPCLVNSSFTDLNLSLLMMGDSFKCLAANLKFSAITHLDLTMNDINDDGIDKLAECLRETKIIGLNLNRNLITSRGAIALALSLKGSNILSLQLDENKIEYDGVKALAQHAETTLITTLEINCNPGSTALAEMVMWKNRRVVHQLISFFKRVAPVTGDSILRLEGIANATNVDAFLEECLNFYETVTKRSSAASVLAREKDISLSKDQITELVFDKFPKQFVKFVASKIQADLPDQIKMLKRVEELGLSRIVELLLLNRHIYTIDKSHNILHPYVYKLLNKYKIPICNLEGDPLGIEKIIKYFSSFADKDGAPNCMFCDVTSMLKDINRMTKKRHNRAGLPQVSSSKEPSSEKMIVVAKKKKEDNNRKRYNTRSGKT